MTQDRARQIDRNLLAILDATRDLLFEVRVPGTGDELRDAPRIQQLAFCECVRRVGEAVAQIDSIDEDWLTTNLPAVPWRAVKATRNRLTHQYWTIDYEILHTIATVALRAVAVDVSAKLGVANPYDDLPEPR